MDFKLENPPTVLSDVELHILQETFASPVIKKYLQTLCWNSLRDLASIPITEVASDSYRLKHAYTKGGIGMLMTLLSIDKENQPPV